MKTFTYDGETYNVPPTWQNVDNAEDWFYEIEKAKWAMINNAHKYPPMKDEDGDEIDPQFVVLMNEYGMETTSQWSQFHFGYSNELWNKDGEEMMSFMWRMSDIGRKKMIAETAVTESAEGGVLAPIEGITVQQWAKAQAKMASGGTLQDAYDICGCDAAKYDRVSAEWLARMSNDTEFKIMPIYSEAFNTSATGNMGSGSDTNDTTISFEKFVESMAAQDVLGKQGRDAQSVLAEFGMTVADYSNISSHWFGKMAGDYELGLKFAALSEEYTKKYESMVGDAHGDLEF